MPFKAKFAPEEPAPVLDGELVDFPPLEYLTGGG
jgi:hypothetical protein